MIVTQLTACSKSSTAPTAPVTIDMANEPFQESQETPQDLSDFDFNGTWEGLGTVDPRTIWSLNEILEDSRYKDRGYQQPTMESTPCHVLIKIRYSKNTNFKIDAAEITLPEMKTTNPYFHATLTNTTFRPPITNFDPPDFTITSGSGENKQILAQKHITGNYQYVYGSGELFLNEYKLSITSGGPYIGTYPNGSGGEFITTRDFNFSWGDGELHLNQISFSSRGNSFRRFIDARCENVNLRRINSVKPTIF